MVRGADDYLPKPVTPKDVLDSVHTQLQKRAVIEEKHDTNLRTLRRNIIYALPHEFRTPLGIILGYAQMIEFEHRNQNPQDILESAQAISSAGRRLQSLIENYLVYAQLEVITSDPVEREAARNHLVKNAGAIISDASQQKAVAYNRLPDLRLDVARMALRISEDNLKKIVNELVDNAFKFSEPGTPVEVRAFPEDHSFVLSIRDFGRGMTESDINQMGAYMQFGREIFEQQGVGLGFVIARRLVALHDGDFQIESQTKHSTCITIRFQAF
jgi:K+-sensing histidine kinase KdpD